MPALHVALVRVRVPLLYEAEDVMQSAGWEWMQLEQERYQIAVQALSRCLASGAKKEDVETLARECGIDPKHIEITEQKV